MKGRIRRWTQNSTFQNLAAERIRSMVAKFTKKVQSHQISDKGHAEPPAKTLPKGKPLPQRHNPGCAPTQSSTPNNGSPRKPPDLGNGEIAFAGDSQNPNRDDDVALLISQLAISVLEDIVTEIERNPNAAVAI